LGRFEEPLAVIYEHYFARSGKEGEQEEIKTFIKMSRELGFIPKVTSKPVAQLVFGFLAQRNSRVAFRACSPREGKFLFDLSCFMDYLIVLSHLAHRGEEPDQVKLSRLLQAMQVSQGYQKIAKTVKVAHFFTPETELMHAVHPKTHPLPSSPLRSSPRMQQLIV
jgi:hypothetical protein